MKNKSYDYKIKENVSYIYLEQRSGRVHEIIIDTEDLERVLNYKYRWGVYFDPHIDSFYVRATVYKYGNVYLHRFLLNLDNDGVFVDHKTNNTLDNRKKNLRESTSGNNSKNRKSANSNNTSGYRNVTRIDGYWRIQLQVDGKNKLFPEKFTDVDDAGKFAEEMRIKYYSEFAGRN